jgi:thiol-disulfide isomerase/thioredoxin
VNVHRFAPRGVVVLIALTAVLGLVAAPALASAGQREVSSKVKVKGKALKSSEVIGTADDPAIGKKAPRLSGQGFDGEKVVFASDGTPRIVLFVAHWCPHCQREVPLLAAMASDGELDGVEIDTVTTNTDEASPNYPPSEWLEREDWPFSPVLADDAALRAFSAFGGNSFPYFVAVDADGRVAGRFTGELPKSDIAKLVERLVAGKSLFG